MNSALGENKNQQLALTQSQSLIWTGQQLSADAPIYNMAFLFTWEGAIDPAIFRQAFARLLEQSDAMRTVFLPTDGQAVQQVLPQMEFELEQLDFSDRTAEDISQWAKKRSTQSFDIETRLFDSALLRLGPDRSAWYLCQHHLITDGWSKTVQYKALADFYQQIAGQQALTELPSFADYVHFEAEKRQRPVADYWQRSQEWPAHKALFHGQANADRRTESVRIGFQLDADKTAALRAIALEPDLRAWTVDLSLFQIFSTLLFACINRISGQQKLTVGIPVPNRPSAQFKKTPGLFTELFPLMVEVKGGDTFASLFQRVRAEAFECLKFATPGQSRAAVNKGFQVVLNYMNGSFDDFDGRPVQAEWIFADHADPGHHLRLQIFDFNKKGTIEVAIDANAAVFTEAQRTQLLADFAELLDRFLADRFQRIHPLSEAELALLQTLDLTEVGYPKHKTIVDLFEEQATTHPERMALSLGTQSMSYEQLNRRANQLAHWLRQEGVTKEVLVGLCLDRSFEMIIGLLAVQKAGGVYVPIDPDYPQQRIDYMLEDAVLGHLVTTSAHRDLFAKHDLQLHLIDDLEEMLKQQPVTLPVTDLTPDHPLYVIYTSGSTGRPKGVLITHCNVLRLMVNEQPLFDFGQSDVWTLFHSYCFDFSVWEMYGALLFGGRLV
ncbi:MAG: condensation domain-containing protein, partial [Bacteroidota bacterium]